MDIDNLTPEQIKKMREESAMRTGHIAPQPPKFNVVADNKITHSTKKSSPSNLIAKSIALWIAALVLSGIGVGINSSGASAISMIFFIMFTFIALISLLLGIAHIIGAGVLIGINASKE